MNLDGDRAILSPLEIIHLMADGLLTLRKSDQEIGLEQFLEKVAGQDHEFVPKASVYRDLRKRGYIPRTGYKFGHHFRVYTGKKLHSELLVHAITSEHLPMSSISRSVRLANSVKKKMLFALQNSTEIQYLEFSWIKL